MRKTTTLRLKHAGRMLSGAADTACPAACLQAACRVIIVRLQHLSTHLGDEGGREVAVVRRRPGHHVVHEAVQHGARVQLQVDDKVQRVRIVVVLCAGTASEPGR